MAPSLLIVLIVTHHQNTALHWEPLPQSYISFIIWKCILLQSFLHLTFLCALSSCPLCSCSKSRYWSNPKQSPWLFFTSVVTSQKLFFPWDYFVAKITIKWVGFTRLIWNSTSSKYEKLLCLYHFLYVYFYHIYIYFTKEIKKVKT